MVTRPKPPQTRQNPQLGNLIRFLTKVSLINEGKSTNLYMSTKRALY